MAALKENNGKESWEVRADNEILQENVRMILGYNEMTSTTHESWEIKAEEVDLEEYKEEGDEQEEDHEDVSSDDSGEVHSEFTMPTETVDVPVLTAPAPSKPPKPTSSKSKKR